MTTRAPRRTPPAAGNSRFFYARPAPVPIPEVESEEAARLDALDALKAHVPGFDGSTLTDDE